MGFRSVFISDCSVDKWPKWFKNKWRRRVNISRRRICSKFPAKYYDDNGWRQLPADISRVVPKDDSISLVYLHECGGITKYKISRDSVSIIEPETWNKVKNEPEHYECHGCSDADKVKDFTDIAEKELEYAKNRENTLISELSFLRKNIAAITAVSMEISVKNARGETIDSVLFDRLSDEAVKLHANYVLMAHVH